MSDRGAPVNGRLRRFRDRHFDCYVNLARTAEEAGDQNEWLGVFDAELANIRTAIEWGLATSRRETAAFTASLLWYWRERRFYKEGRRILARVLRERDLLPLERADALLAAGWLANDQGDSAVARDHYEAARRLAVSNADPARQARAAHGLGWSLSRLLLHDEAVEAFTEANELGGSLSVSERADVLRGMGWARAFNEGPEVSLALHREARLLLEEARDPELTSHYLVETVLLVGCGRVQEALALADKSAEFARAAGRPRSFAFAAKANAATASGDRELLRQVLEEGIQVARSEESRTVEAKLQQRLAVDAIAAGEMSLARDALDSGLRLLDDTEALDFNALAFRAETLVLRADLADDEGDIDVANELYRQAIAIYARSSVRYHATAFVDEARLHVGHREDGGRRALERRALEVVERIDPAMGALVRIDFAILAGDLDEALRMTTEALEVAPVQMPNDVPGLLWRKAAALAELDRPHEAAAASDELVATGFGGPVAFLERARIHIATGDDEAARSDLLDVARAARLGRAHHQLELATTLARLALLEGREDRAREIWSAVLDYRSANDRLAPRLSRRFEEPLRQLTSAAPRSLDSRDALDGVRSLVSEEFSRLARAAGD